jgi:hypothetical protein
LSRQILICFDNLFRLSINLTPFKHPEKSSIFLGTRFIPLSTLGEGAEVLKEGLTPLLNTQRTIQSTSNEAGV